MDKPEKRSRNKPEATSFEVRLSELEHLYRAVPVGLCLMDRELRIACFNEPMAAISGLPSTKLFGLTILEIIPALAQQIEPLCRKVIETRLPVLDIELHAGAIQDSGREGYWLAGVHPLLAIDGSVLGVSLTLQDIAEKMDDEDRFRFERLLLELSSKFVNIPPEEVDQEIELGLKRVVEFLEADRSSIAEFTPDKSRLFLTHSYAAPGVQSLPRIILSDLLPWFTEKLRRGETIVVEKLEDLPEEATAERQFYMAEGIKSFVSLPLMVEDSIMGAIGFGTLRSERTWSVDLVQRLHLLGKIFTNALTRKRDRLAVDERLKFESLVSRFSAQLINLQTGEVDRIIQEGLKLVGDFFDVDRVFISPLLPDVKGWRPSHFWLAEAYKRQRTIFFDTGTILLPNVTAQLQRGEPLIVGSPEQLPQEWREEREYTRSLGLKAGVVVPLSVGGVFIGLICIDSIHAEREWPIDTVPRLKFIGEILANALARKRSEESLRKALSEIQALKEQLQAENLYLREEIKTVYGHDEIVGRSEVMKKVLIHAEQVAATDTTVLVLGETGTGKELLARSIHRLSSRKDQGLVKVNCAAMPATLVESELFGREKGAFTGALTKQIGRFEVADGATIFLDEVGELTLEVQAKLLRVLQEGQFERLGNPKTFEVDVRVIAATNRDLTKAVKDGEFREDLFYRLNVFPIVVPPLRERAEDIPTLVWWFVKELGEKMGKRIQTIPRKDMEALQRQPWPGNIRELRNTIERAMILTAGTTLRIAIPQAMGSTVNQSVKLQEVEKMHLTNVLDRTGWRIRGIGGAAEILGLKPTTLESKMAKLGLKRK